MKKLETIISTCEECAHGTSSKVYTSDSWDDIRKVHCSKLGKDVHSYLDWNEASTIPKECPLENL
jgi:hypothetical protein